MLKVKILYDVDLIKKVRFLFLVTNFEHKGDNFRSFWMVLLVIETSNIKEASLKGNLIYEFDSKLDLIKEIKDQAIANHKEFTQNDPLGKVIY